MIGFNEVTSLYVTEEEIPFAFSSVAKAIEYIRGLRRVGAEQPVTVFLPEETFLSRTLSLTEADRAITFAPRGKRAKIIGGVELTGFCPDTYNGVACLSAPLPEKCMDENGHCNFTDLYVNGARASLTRYPEEGYFHSDGVEKGNLGIFDGADHFVDEAGALKGLSNISEIQLSFCHYWDDEHTPIESYDPVTGEVKMKYRSRFRLCGGDGAGLDYYLENVGEAFAKPGQWYADAGRVYYIPRDASETPETLRVFAPLLHELVRLEGKPGETVRNIRFRDIDFSVTRGEYASRGQGNLAIGEHEVAYATDAQAVSNAGGSICFAYASGCSLEGCSVQNFGLHGVVIGKGCRNIRILSCLLRDGGAGGVKIEGGAAGTDETEHTFGNRVEDCRILFCGRRYFAACGVLLIHTFENTISHNEIAHLYYTGVSVGWVWGYRESISRDNRIEKNHIHDLGSGMLSDMGGVYLLGKQPGTLVSGNVIHDVTSKYYGGWALYTDEGSSFMTLENNICYNTSDNCYHQHYGSMNTVRNNIFAFSGKEMVRVSRHEPHLSIVFENNIIYSDNSVIYDLSREQLEQKTVSLHKNLIFDASRPDPVMRKGRTDALSFADVQKLGQETDSVVADPLFADAKAYNFTLSPDSPALKMGFRPIDTHDVGPRA